LAIFESVVLCIPVAAAISSRVIRKDGSAFERLLQSGLNAGPEMVEAD